jgi:hypothetical protein
MVTEPRVQHEYGAPEIDAARRVLVDLGQVLGSWFKDSFRPKARTFNQVIVR